MKRIGIDISQMIYGTGVSTYTENLVKNLLTLDEENRYVLFGGSLRRAKDLKRKVNCFEGNYQMKLLPLSPVMADILWNRLHLISIERLIGQIDLFHSSDWTQPPTKAVKVTTIHDLSPIIMPQVAQKDMVRNIVRTHLNRLSWVKHEVGNIIAVSKSTKEDIIKYLGISEDRIKVIYQGFNPEFTRKESFEIEEVKKKYRVFGNYLLVVGTHPRKNVARIIQAYESMKGKLDHKLIIVGSKINSDERGIIQIGNLAVSELACLYSGASALVYPSLYEGFGVPILEAFACQCPVVTSDLSSMPEIAGNAAILVNPYETDSIAHGITQALKQNNDLILRGQERLKSFSWKEAAQETLALYKEALG
jgi:glycosyltransferase involved in cell wall biosynthesis